MEGALKLARKWGYVQGKRQIYGLTDSFHGRTLGALSITGREKYRDGYGPFLPETSILGFNNVDELEQGVNERTLAVVLEFIQGEGGIHLVTREYVEALRVLRDKFGFLVIADEIQSGLGRTGRFFSFEHFDIRPDIVVMAKALGGGLPLGAFIATDQLADVFTPGTHGTTFGGNPVACAAGVATLEQIIHKGLMNQAATLGGFLIDGLSKVRTELPELVRDVRGLGLMVGLDLSFDGSEVVEEMMRRGVLLNLTAGTVVRWLPPLIVTREEIAGAIETAKVSILHVQEKSRKEAMATR
jgi:acetylornithine aminotransferase